MEIFTVRSDETGYMFDLVNNEGDILGTSESYFSKSLALHAMESTKKHSQNSNIEDRTKSDCPQLSCPKYELYKEESGVHRFKLYSITGDCLFTSVGFSSKSLCLQSIVAVRRCAPLASLIVACQD